MADEHGKKVVMVCKMKFRTASSCNFQLQKHQLYDPIRKQDSKIL